MGKEIESYGPYGSELQENYRMQLGDGERITEIIIRYMHIVDAIGFIIVKPDGVTTTKMFGGNGGTESKIPLKDGEYLTSISGKYGYDRGRQQKEIASLMIHTNLCLEGYGPYGLGLDVETTHDFSSPYLNDGRIVGVYGRHNKNVLASIGILLSKRQEIERYGPYGSPLQENFDMLLEDGEDIKEVHVRHGSVINGIRFMIIKAGGGTIEKSFGGNVGEESKIVLKDEEFITKLSGLYGYHRDSKQCVIATLKLHTNLCPTGNGPYGLGRDVDNICDFTSPLLTDSSIVGIIGRHNDYVESIGVVIKKKDLIEPYGPYGSQLSKNFCMQLEDGERITKIGLTHGWMVDRLEFVIAKPSKVNTSVMFGGNGGEYSEIILKDGEYLTRISGTYGYDTARKQDNIASIKIHTNLCPAGYGPFGLGLDVEVQYDFSSPYLTNGPIIGVFGRSNSHLESIGVLLKKGRVIESYGPYGSLLQQNYVLQLKEGEHISEVRVIHGYVVDSIGFVVKTPQGSSTSVIKSGGKGQEEVKIVFKEGEYLTRISGTYGNYKHQNNECLIATLKIHTNLHLVGYGPFGLGKDVDSGHEFSSPLLNDNPIIGVYGRSNNHVESIGVLLRKDFLP